jgi:DNA-binding transcriptional regulator/RsmH inhibitor MraZ
MSYSKIKILSRNFTKKPTNFPTPNTTSTSRQKGSLLVKNLLHGGMKTIQIVKSQLILLRNGLITKMKILQAIMFTGVSTEIEINEYQNFNQAFHIPFYEPI